jgi:hypothetical protein
MRTFSRYRERGKVIKAETQAILGQSIQKVSLPPQKSEGKGIEKVRAS